MPKLLVKIREEDKYIHHSLSNDEYVTTPNIAFIGISIIGSQENAAKGYYFWHLLQLSVIVLLLAFVLLAFNKCR